MLPNCQSEKAVNLKKIESNMFETNPEVSVFKPEQKLTITSMPQSVTSLCHFYPRLCLKPEEAQFVRLADEYGKPLLLISSIEGRSVYAQKLPALWRAIRRTH